MLLHKSFLLVLYCEKLVLDFERFPKDYKQYMNDKANNYWKNILMSFKVNAGPHFE